MTDDEVNELAKKLSDDAFVCNLLKDKAQALSPMQWAVAAQALAIWIDQLHMVTAIFYAQMDGATDTAGAQAAVETFANNMLHAAGERTLDLRTAIGDYVPARDDHNRQTIFLAVTTSTNKQ